MNKNITLVMGIVASLYVISSFFGNSETGEIFGYVMNIWAYRLFWAFLAVLILLDYSRKYKADKEK